MLGVDAHDKGPSGPNLLGALHRYRPKGPAGASRRGAPPVSAGPLSQERLLRKCPVGQGEDTKAEGTDRPAGWSVAPTPR